MIYELTLIMKQKLIFFLYILVLILPNIILCITETMPLSGKLAQLLIPLGFYWFILSLSAYKSKTLWWMFPFIFLAAFNIVLSYLFGKGVIAVDMWLNLTTSSPSEMGEMLSQIYPSVVAVVLIYIPTLIYATYDIYKKNKLPQNFLKKQRVIALTILGFACPCSIIAIQTRNWSILNDLFPINVSYNFYLAIERQKLSENYLENSKEFCFNAIDTSNDSIPKVLMLVIGETSRTANWQLNGYKRETNPLLSRTENMIFFKDCMSQSNTTHKSIPIILSPATADKFDVLYHSKGLLAAYNEAKYHTVFISNQPRNKSFNDYLGEQAQEVTFLRDSLSGTPMDSLLIPEIQHALTRTNKNMLIVVHTYGSHSTYSDRYQRHHAYFKPDQALKSTKENRDILINAYDNSIRYTDKILHNIITKLQTLDIPAAMLFVSDHGEDIYDDNRNLFLHASPWPSYYQMHVPFFIWTNEKYRNLYPERVSLLESRKSEPIQTDCVFPTMLGLAGISTPLGQDSLSLTSDKYVTKKNRTYLNDHNESLTFDRCLESLDFKVMQLQGVRTH